MPKVTEEAYLCRVNAGAFVVTIDGRTISTTTIPSAAAHMCASIFGSFQPGRFIEFLNDNQNTDGHPPAQLFSVHQGRVTRIRAARFQTQQVSVSASSQTTWPLNAKAILSLANK
jgi:hypothetical protein